MSLCLIKGQGIKTLCQSGGVAPRVLNCDTRKKWVVSLTTWLLNPEGEMPVPAGWENGWTPAPVWTLWRKEKSLTLAGYRTAISMSPSTQAYHCNNWAIPATFNNDYRNCVFLMAKNCTTEYSHALYSQILNYFFSLALQPPWALASAIQFHDHFTDGRTPWTSDQLVARPLPKHRTTQTQNKHIHTPNIHALCGIRNNDPSFRASEESSYLRSLGYCDRHKFLNIRTWNSQWIITASSFCSIPVRN
jgi:hypothetical protein